MFKKAFVAAAALAVTIGAAGVAQSQSYSRVRGLTAENTPFSSLLLLQCGRTAPVEFPGVSVKNVGAAPIFAGRPVKLTYPGGTAVMNLPRTLKPGESVQMLRGGSLSPGSCVARLL